MPRSDGSASAAAHRTGFLPMCYNQWACSTRATADISRPQQHWARHCAVSSQYGIKSQTTCTLSILAVSLILCHSPRPTASASVDSASYSMRTLRRPYARVARASVSRMPWSEDSQRCQATGRSLCVFLVIMQAIGHAGAGRPGEAAHKPTRRRGSSSGPACSSRVARALHAASCTCLFWSSTRPRRPCSIGWHKS